MSVLSDTHDFYLNAGSAGSPRTDFAVRGKQAKMKGREEGRQVSDRRLERRAGAEIRQGGGSKRARQHANRSSSESRGKSNKDAHLVCCLLHPCHPLFARNTVSFATFSERGMLPVRKPWDFGLLDVFL